MNRTEQKRERKQSVRVLAALLAACVLSACSGGGGSQDSGAAQSSSGTQGNVGTQSGGSSAQGGGNAAAGASGRMEGEGFASAEDAAKAYIEGFIANDIDAMLSACAVETYVERFDLEKFIELVGGYNNTPGALSAFVMPPAGEGSARYRMEQRRSELTQQMSYRYYYLVQPDLFEQMTGGPMVLLNEYDSAAQLMQENFRTDENVLKDIRLVSVEELSSLLKAAEKSDTLVQGLLESMEQRATMLGADEVTGLALLLDIAGTEYYFIPDLVRYGDSWYYYSSAGVSAAFFQISATTGGLIPADEVK